MTIYDVIQKFRERPLMHIGYRSLRCLQSYISGYQSGLIDSGVQFAPSQPPFHDFHRWTAERFGRGATTEGWCNSIIAGVGSDEAALDAFFPLLDDFLRTHPSAPPPST